MKRAQEDPHQLHVSAEDPIAGGKSQMFHLLAPLTSLEGHTACRISSVEDFYQDKTRPWAFPKKPVRGPDTAGLGCSVQTLTASEAG